MPDAIPFRVNVSPAQTAGFGCIVNDISGAAYTVIVVSLILRQVMPE